MKNKFIYIHGFDSSHLSQKSLKLQAYFTQFDYGWMDWTVMDDMEKLLDNLEKELEPYENPIVYGDSTGANFAYQLRQRRESKGKKTILIMTSPLLINKLRISIEHIPQSFRDRLQVIDNPKNALIIASPEDETLDETWLWEKKFENVELISVSDRHELHKFSDYIPMMEDYINRKL